MTSDLYLQLLIEIISRTIELITFCNINSLLMCKLILLIVYIIVESIIKSYSIIIGDVRLPISRTKNNNSINNIRIIDTVLHNLLNIISNIGYF